MISYRACTILIIRVGVVPEHPTRVGRPGLEAMDVGNGDLAPEWGIDFVIHGGQVNYGPWADRQRFVLF